MSTDARSDASMLLKSVWGDRSIPVDPIFIARQLGIDVYEATLPDAVSGAIIKDKGKDPVIVLSKTDSDKRKRFSCAHEIGHYVWRTSNGEETYEYVDLRSGSAHAGDKEEEIYANRFAASLLMPAEEVERMHKKGIPSFIMAQKFGVSDDAMAFRLKNLRLI